LSFRMKISGLLDTTNSFIIKQMLLGMQRLHKRVQEDQLQLICSCILLMLYSIRVHQFMKLLYFRLVFHLPFLHFYELVNLLNLICQRGICYNIPIYQLIRKMV
jgi:hypothetical protein